MASRQELMQALGNQRQAQMTHTGDYGYAGPDDSRLRALAGILTEIAPGSGDVLAAQRSGELGAMGAQALREGRYGDALASYVSSGTEAATTLPVIGELAGAAKLLGSGLAGITAWHGSPHVFDAFDHSKMGTGEGAQAYGWGTYLAESPDVADQYRINLSYDPEEMRIGGTQINEYYDRLQDQANRAADPGDLYDKANIIERLMGNETPDSVESWADSLGVGDWFRSEIKPNFKSYGNLYEVDVPDEAIASMVDWDKPLSAQSPVVQSALERALISDGWDSYLQAVKNYDAGDTKAMKKAGYGLFDYPGAAGGIYQTLATDLGPRGASELLQRSGIPGIQYLDQASRGAGEGTRNFVVFDPEIARIVRRNSEEIKRGGE